MQFNLLSKFVGFLVVLGATAVRAFAGGFSTVPEVDPGSIGTAIALLVGGYLVVISRSQRK